jgi:Fur family ferric uptake transcriptional regulator
MYGLIEQKLILKLKEHKVHLTKNRIAVYKFLIESKTALSVSLITKNSEKLLDRISVHRALRYFVKKGLVEIVPNTKGNAKYILAASNNNLAIDRTNKSAYFVCSTCQKTELVLEPVYITIGTEIEKKINKYSLIIEGICSKCQ